MLGYDLNQNERDALLSLYDNFLYEVRLSTIKKYDPASILFELIEVTKNNRTRIFTNISIPLSNDVSKNLRSHQLIQKVSVQGINKWTITLKGMAYNIFMNENHSFDEQYENLLTNFDNKYSLESGNKLDWKEKLVTLSLLLMVSTSEKDAVRLDNISNRELIEEMFSKTLSNLNQHNVLGEYRTLPTSRGEPPATLIMRSRVNDLPAKTSYIYINLGRSKGYFLDIEQGSGLDSGKMWFLLDLIFEEYDQEIDYYTLKNELIEICEQYSTQILTRSVDPIKLFETLAKIDEYFTTEIMNLPLKA